MGLQVYEQTKEVPVGCPDEKSTGNTWVHRASTSTTTTDSVGATWRDEDRDEEQNNRCGVERSLKKSGGKTTLLERNASRDKIELFAKTRMCPLIKKVQQGGKSRYTYTNMYKTKMWKALSQGRCAKSSDECSFAHSFETLRCSHSLFNARLCSFWMNGRCIAESMCRFAHGEEDITSIATGVPMLYHLDPSPEVVSSPPVRDDCPSPDGVWRSQSKSPCRSLVCSSSSCCLPPISPRLHSASSPLPPLNKSRRSQSRRSAPAILEQERQNKDVQDRTTRPKRRQEIKTPEISSVVGALPPWNNCRVCAQCSRQPLEGQRETDGSGQTYLMLSSSTILNREQDDSCCHKHLCRRQTTDCTETIPFGVTSSPATPPLCPVSVHMDTHQLFHDCTPAVPPTNGNPLPVETKAPATPCLTAPSLSSSSSYFCTPLSSPVSCFSSPSVASSPSLSRGYFYLPPVEPLSPPADRSDRSYHGCRVCDWCHGYPGGVVGGWEEGRGTVLNGKAYGNPFDGAVMTMGSTRNSCAHIRWWCDAFGVVRCVRCCGARPPVFWQLDRLRSDPSIGTILTDLQAGCLYLD
eukprot:GHVS01053495.1.p1 GENE.GHVS01053495.1~~GHVS01053495.1.p1  ORF type:complete len:578 (+),score=56.62 GHVS01053495.1:217-1950(+)